MPWTLSHPAAVLPLRRFTPRPLDFAALVFGSMAPDLGYYINQFGLATFAHTLPGTLFAAFPTALVFLFLFYFVRRPVCYCLPGRQRQALLPLCQSMPTGFSRWAIILVSLLIGVWTHTFWDAWTHDSGWFVLRIPALQRPLFHIGKNLIYLPLFLQVLSTFVGFAILVVAHFLWLRRQPAEVEADSENDAWRYAFWAAVIVAAALLGMLLAYDSASSRHGFLLARAIMFRTSVFGTDVGVPLAVIASLIVYARRSPNS